MAVYKITPTTSRFVSGGDAFNEGSSGADSLTIDDGAYLVARTTGFFGADLDGPGIWTVKVNGSIVATDAHAIILRPGIAGVSTITVGATGEVGSYGGASIFAGSAASIKNDGMIYGYLNFNGGAANSLNNTGTILRNYDFQGVGTEDAVVNSSFLASAMTITNTGYIDGRISLLNGNDVVTNNGIIDGAIRFQGGNNKYTSTVATSRVENIYSGSGDDTIKSAGGIGDVELGDGKNSLTLTKTGSAGAILGGSGNDTIVNAGRIEGDVELLGGADAFTNSGTYIAGTNGVDSFEGLKLTNTGTFTGDVGVGRDSTVTNSGTFTGDVSGYLSFTNTKTFTGDVAFFNGGGRVFNNSGAFTGDVTNGFFAVNFTNSGKLTGNVTLGGSNTIKNSGRIDGDVNLSDGDDTVTNAATGVIDALRLGNGINKVTNSGTLGYLLGGENADTITNSGRILDIVELEAGDDIYIGSNFSEEVRDGDGSDNIKLGGGNDTYQAPAGFDVESGSDLDGVDFVDGGAGVDTYVVDRYSGSGGQTAIYDAVYINIDTVVHNETTVAPLHGPIAANSSTGPTGTDTVKGFENVTGSYGDDIIYGNAAANILKGGQDGSDALFGYAGNDTLDGGIGIDALVGGLGADKLTGGAGADHFTYLNASESGPLKAARDTILDFGDGIDLINVSVIDSNTKNGSQFNETFRFIGENTPFVANDPAGPNTLLGQGSLRVIETASGWTIEGEVNNDGKADFAIDVLDPTHLITFTAVDFNL
jgi:Ca2+-binding RTX toxin-like protein